MTSAPAVSWPVVDRDRRNAHAAKRRAQTAGERIAKRRRRRRPAGQARCCRAERAASGRSSSPRRRSRAARRRSCAGVIRSSLGEQVSDDHAPDRRRGVEDRGKPAGDVRLAPAEQDERDRIVEQRQHAGSSPTPGAAGPAVSPRQPQEQPHGRRRRWSAAARHRSAARRASTATLMNMNAAPQISARASRVSHSQRFMTLVDHRRGIAAAPAAPRPAPCGQSIFAERRHRQTPAALWHVGKLPSATQPKPVEQPISLNLWSSRAAAR